LDLTDLIGNALFELLIQLVEIIEQPRILDSDGRLVSEGLNQSDLLLGERSDLLQVINNQDAQQVVALQNRYRQICPKFLEIFGTVRIFRVSQDVGNMDRSAFKPSAASSTISAEPNWISGSKILKLLRSVEGPHHPQKLTIETVNERSV